MASTNEDTEVAVSFADLTTAGNEADVDGTVDAFVVKSISSGSLRIGANAGSATAWAAGTNDTIDASNHAYWTPDADVSGTQNAFALVAKDDGGLESTPSVTAQIDVNAQNDVPTLTLLSSPVASTNEDTEVAVSFADLTTAGNEADVDGTVDAFVVKSISSGSLRIGANAGSATAWAAGTNDTIDASNHAYWTPDADVSGTQNAFALVAKDDGGLESTPSVTAQIDVNAQNDVPTLTLLSSPVASTNEDTEVAVSFADLTTVGNEADVDGTVDAFVVKSISSGSLRIGANAGSATAWAAGTNDTIDASNHAYWTPDADVSGTQNAFALVAKDDGGLESTPSVTAQIDVNAQNDVPTLTLLSSPVASTNEDTEVAVSFADLTTAGNEADVDGTVDAFVVKSISSGSLRIGANAGSATAWVAGTNDTIDASNHAYWTPDADVSGTQNAFALVAKDDGGLESTPSVTAQIDVNAQNDVPTLTLLSSPVASTNEDTEVAVSFADLTTAGNEADVDGTVDAFVVKSISSGSLRIGANAGSATAWAAGTNDTIDASNHAYWTPDADVSGTQNAFALVAKDDGGLESTPSVTAQIDVNAQNDVSTITSTAITGANEDSAYSYTLTVSDVDTGDTLTLSAPTLPAWLSFDTGTGVLSGTPSNAEVGDHNVVLRVNDGTVDVDQNFTITVSNSNDAPTITSTALTSVTEDNAYSYTFTVSDVDAGDSLTLSAPTLPAWLSFNPTTGVLSGTPSNAEVGDHNVVLRVNDGTVDVDQNFTITVSNSNDAPTITSTAIMSATEDSAYSYTFTVSDVDPSDTLTLSAPTLPAWLSFDTGTGVLSGTPSNAEVGDHNVVLRVNDGTVDVDQNFTITVSNSNDAPTITSTALTNATEDSAYSYSFTVSDVDSGDTLTLSAPTLPAWLSFNPTTGVLSGTPSNAEVGDHNVVLRVNDGTVDVDQSFTVTVSNSNDAPTITSTALTNVTEDSAYSYTFTVSDVDAGDSLTLSAPTLPAWLSFDTGTGVLSGTPTNADVGDHNVLLRVNDGTVDVDQNFTVTVSNSNDAPTITSTALTNVTEDSAYSYSFTVSDVDAGDSLTLSAPTLPAWLSFDAGTGVLSGTPTNAEVGDHSVVLRVNDGSVDVDQSFTITVSNVNDAPRLGNNNLTLNAGDTVSMTTALLSANDVDHADPDLTFSVSSVSGGQFELVTAPGVAITSFTQGQVTAGSVIFVDDGDAVAPAFDVTVGDGLDSMGPQAATINFTPPPPPVVTTTATPPLLPAVTPVSPSESQPPAATAPIEETTEDAPTEDAMDEVAEEAVDQASGVNSEPDISPDGADDAGTVTTVAPNINSGVFAASNPALAILKSIMIRPEVMTAAALLPAPQALELDTLTSEIRSLMVSDGFNDSLNRMREDISSATQLQHNVVASSIAATTSLSVGYVAWLVRGGVLLSTALSSLPAWQFIDPLPVLAHTRETGRDDDGQDDSLEEIIKESSRRAANLNNEPIQQTASNETEMPMTDEQTY